MARDNHRCAICAAEFESSAELVRHEKERHAHQARTDSVPVDDASRPGHRREFTRRNPE